MQAEGAKTPMVYVPPEFRAAHREAQRETAEFRQAQVEFRQMLDETRRETRQFREVQAECRGEVKTVHGRLDGIDNTFR